MEVTNARLNLVHISNGYCDIGRLPPYRAGLGWNR
jgi:hypothetical protein